MSARSQGNVVLAIIAQFLANNEIDTRPAYLMRSLNISNHARRFVFTRYEYITVVMKEFESEILIIDVDDIMTLVTVDRNHEISHYTTVLYEFSINDPIALDTMLNLVKSHLTVC